MQNLDRAIPDWLSRYLPAGTLTGELKEQVRDVVAVLVLAFNIIFCFFAVAYTELFLVHNLTTEIVYARNVVYPCAALYLLAALCLYFFNRKVLARVLIISNIFLSCAAGIMMTGGYSVSPIGSLVVLPAIFGFVLMGSRAGIVCAAMSSGVVVMANLLEYYGHYTPMQAIPSRLVWQSLSIFVPLVAMAMVVFSLVFYELLTLRLQKDLQKERNKFHWDATHDALTGLPNRPEFFNRLEQAMRQSARSQQPLGLVFFDLDGFKPINDTLGHHAGDIVLRQVGKRLNGLMRSVDTIARLGGDEFAIILHGASPEQGELDTVLQKILQAVSAPIQVEGREVSVGASLGVAFYEEGCSSDTLCKRADAAMYDAKTVKNTWRLYGT
jgi:diguanylate cyclase (GGDEF)-like protein